MFSCPRCKTALSERRNPSLGLIWVCPSCQGRAMTLDLLRRAVPKSLVDHLWQQARTDRHSTERRCPACQRPVAEVPIILGPDKTVGLDVCTTCYLVWFDPQEFEALSKPKQKPPGGAELSDEAKRALALARLEVLKREQSVPDIAVHRNDTRLQIAIDAISALLDILLT